MATVTKTEVSRTQYTLVLSEEEAQALQKVLWHVGGSPDGPRGLVQKINDGLSEHGIYGVLPEGWEINRTKGSIYIEPIQ